MSVRNRQFFGVLVGLICVQLACLPAAAIDLSGSLRIHDPARIHKLGSRYYTYGTGSPGAPIATRFSDNFTLWQNGPAVFSAIPAWAQAEVPNNPNFMWAPDVFYINGQYRMYYSVSSFGSQNSVIGLATNSTLDFNSPSYAWIDQQVVIESENGSPYNAIDAGIFYDGSTNRMWMTFGSHWNGIYITELDPVTGKRIEPSPNPLNIARNPGSPVNAIEAPYLTMHDGFYYLFVNWDTCCQGVNSTYKIRVGRGTSPTGPFRDRIGLAMTSGGGELFLQTEGNFIGPGHFSDYSENGTDYFSYHYYDGADNGRSKLAIEELAWTFDGWPVLVDDLPPGDFNRDGIVDAADYIVWRKTLGSAAEFEIWRNNFGATYLDPAGSGARAFAAVVPEPSPVCVAGLSLCALLVRSRRTVV